MLFYRLQPKSIKITPLLLCISSPSLLLSLQLSTTLLQHQLKERFLYSQRSLRIREDSTVPLCDLLLRKNQNNWKRHYSNSKKSHLRSLQSLEGPRHSTNEILSQKGRPLQSNIKCQPSSVHRTEHNTNRKQHKS